MRVGGLNCVVQDLRLSRTNVTASLTRLKHTSPHLRVLELSRSPVAGVVADIASMQVWGQG